MSQTNSVKPRLPASRMRQAIRFRGQAWLAHLLMKFPPLSDQLHYQIAMTSSLQMNWPVKDHGLPLDKITILNSIECGPLRGVRPALT